MKTKLIEFPNKQNEILRGILSLPDSQITQVAICVHGFERCSSTEKKFKTLSDTLVARGMAVFRLDFSGCGLSDGEFRSTTITKQADELVLALSELTRQLGDHKINVIAHSLGACAVAKAVEQIKNKLNKIVLIAPALNQKDLLRYRFVLMQMKKSSPQTFITWQNYTRYLDEEAFQNDCAQKNQMTKINYLDSDYFMESKELDFSKNFDELKEKVLYIHGSGDFVVPIGSINTNFSNQIIIEDGEHDLERPYQIKRWQNAVVKFLFDRKVANK